MTPSDDNFWWLILVAAGWLIQRINAAKKKAAQTRPGGGRPAPQPPRRAAMPDAEEAERTRRVREEIRRKIEARRSPEPPPLAPSWAQDARVEAEQAAGSSSTVDVPNIDDLADEIKAQETANAALILQEEQAAVAAPEVAPPRAQNLWIQDLRQPDSIRRAIVLREVLGPPVGLR